MKKLPVFKKLFQRRPSLPSVRVLVTGSRGKSSMVRLLTAVLEDAGISPGRITGVLPRNFFAEGEADSACRPRLGRGDEVVARLPAQRGRRSCP